MDLQRRRVGSLKEGIYGSLLFLCAALSIAITVGIVMVLIFDTVDFFGEIPLAEFVFGTRWSPGIRPHQFGVLPLVTGTLTFTALTAVFALPVGTLAATFLSEYAGDRPRAVLKPMLEILSGIPTVVYGYFALVYITPLLEATLFPHISTFNVLSASIVVAIMIIPTIASISEDAMRAVPNTLRHAGHGLGVTKFQVTTSVVIPSALSGILSSYILAISRAIGETMAVVIAAGNLPRMVNWLDPGDAFLRPIQTMTAAMVELGLSDVAGMSVAYKSLFAVGFALFIVTFALNIVSQLIRQRFREQYE